MRKVNYKKERGMTRREWVRAYMKRYNPFYRKTHAVEIKARAQERKRWCIDYLGGQCKRCGYKRCQAALAFHHKDPSKKSRQLAVMMKWSLARIMQELKKCELLCMNCHAELHWEERNANRVHNRRSLDH